MKVSAGLIRAYGWAGINVLLLLGRDALLISQGQQAISGLLALIVFANISASVFTDYIANNKNIFSRSALYFIFISSIVTILIGSGNVFAGVLSFCMASVVVAAIVSPLILAGKYWMLQMTAALEGGVIVFILSLAVIFGKFEIINFTIFAVLRVVLAGAALCVRHPERASRQAGIASANFSLLMIVSMLALCLSAAANYMFFQASSPAEAAVGRFIAYALGVLAIGFNFIADRVADKLHNNRLFRISLALLCLQVVATVLLIDMVYNSWSVYIFACLCIIAAAISLGTRIESRLPKFQKGRHV